MRQKITKEEHDAFLNVLQPERFRFNRISSQSRSFKWAFYFTNFYVFLGILSAIFTSQFFSGLFYENLADFGGSKAQESRNFIYFVIIVAFIISFYFNVSFRIISIVAFFYTLNILAENFVHLFYFFDNVKIGFLIFYSISPVLLLLSIAVAVHKFEDE